MASETFYDFKDKRMKGGNSQALNEFEGYTHLPTEEQEFAKTQITLKYLSEIESLVAGSKHDEEFHRSNQTKRNQIYCNVIDIVTDLKTIHHSDKYKNNA